MSEYALLLLRATTGVLLRCTTTADDYYVLRTTITYYDDVLQCTPYDYDYDYNVRILRSAMYAVLLRRLQLCTLTYYMVRRIIITTYYDVLRTAHSYYVLQCIAHRNVLRTSSSSRRRRSSSSCCCCSTRARVLVAL